MNESESPSNDLVVVRMIKFADIASLTNQYCNLRKETRRFFHPFPFNRSKVFLIFFVLWIDRYILPVIKRIAPRLGGNLVVAFDTCQSVIVGFAFFNITAKEGSKFVANAGPIIFEEFQGKKLGQRLYHFLIKCAKDAGISKFKVTVMEANIPSTMFHKKLGYVSTGYAKDEFWDGTSEKNVKWELVLSELKNS